VAARASYFCGFVSVRRHVTVIAPRFHAGSSAGATHPFSCNSLFCIWSGRMANVLLVEDDANFLRALETMLVFKDITSEWLEAEQRHSMTRRCTFLTLS
jgi:hypothetical protein